MNVCEKTEAHKFCALGVIVLAGVVIGVTATLLLVPESKQIEKTLRKMKKKMDATIDAGKDALDKFVEDSEDKLKELKDKTQGTAEDVINMVKKKP